MENKGGIGQWFEKIGSKISDKISEQSFFQELKSKWDELDAQSKTYAKYGASGGASLIILGILLSSILTVRGLRNELEEKSELLHTLQSANDELRTLRDTIPANAQGQQSAAPGGGSWSTYFEAQASGAGVEKSALTVSTEKSGQSTDVAKESLFDINLKKVSIKQIMRFAVGLESGTRPIKLRNLLIDTKSDPNGYMDATLSVSAFALNPS